MYYRPAVACRAYFFERRQVLVKEILNTKSTLSTLMRLSYEIVEKNQNVDSICIVGIRRRGAAIAKIIAENIKKIGACEVLCGEVDISLYRDDLSSIKDQPIVNETAIDFFVEGKTVVLVDDVLFTGRTARAAMDAVVALGRPAKIQLCELVDRGHRELPIRADFVGKNVPTSLSEKICVKMPEYDAGQMSVNIERK